jgi:CRP-like cAMP-binding protein
MQVGQPHLSPSSSLEKLLKGASILPCAETDLPPEAFLAKSGPGRKIVIVQKQQSIFSQGDAADAVFYIQKGKVKLTVFSQRGKEAIIALLGAGDFAGEECVMAPKSQRLATAVALTTCTLLRIERGEMVKALHEKKTFSDFFVSFLLRRNIRSQEDLIDQLFNSSEKRLARALLLLAQSVKDEPEKVIPKISQEALAEIVGTTRSRVCFFMNRFRELGYIDYNDDNRVLRVHGSLLSVVLHE